ncbi:uncharacterized protein PpBr36_06030 [Pyricularia pennisetigena]|uniref:uncharacterized protein n=1 Tax=Pyricularia pennisetigena TaxID=1578925 RepID=UPI0011527E31|nr:uncharacterized protein PpBr36_06030 [Pyricularia pennisetigena]TLS23326.1 hypothetical protein PpBr36_06030 [Pyricularia pennisetigena]
MARTTAVRTYGRTRRTKAVLISPDTAQQAPSRIDYSNEDKENHKPGLKPKRKEFGSVLPDDGEENLVTLTERIKEIHIDEPRLTTTETKRQPTRTKQQPSPKPPSTPCKVRPEKRRPVEPHSPAPSDQPILCWGDVCPPGDRIEKIAEASYAEVYRISNERGTSIIKVVRLESPIKPQTKAQEMSGLVDEEPHGEDDLGGEVRISEWLADIPGFVVYKERFVVKGKATKELLQTHQAFHRRMKRKDPDRLQFYPSPSRYLPETKFLVLELGDAGVSLEDFKLDSISQVWDVLLLVAIALARAEYQVGFEHRDLHEGNLCVRQVRPPKTKEDSESPIHFGFSGLDITILDYGLSRAQDPDMEDAEPIAFDLEKDLSLFTSTHAPQCKVYRQMRSYMIKGDRAYLPPRFHNKPYDGGSISWSEHHPFTNVLWLAYIYEYMAKHFCGDKRDLAAFKKTTRELWAHLNPDAPPDVQSFSSAADVVRFVVEAGWVTEAQVTDDHHGGDGDDEDEYREEASIIEVQSSDRDDSRLRRSPRRRQGPSP